MMHRNIKVVRRDFHEAWHTIFGNMTPIEVAEFIVRLSPVGYFKKVVMEAHLWNFTYLVDLQTFEQQYSFRDLKDTKKVAWQKLFANKEWFWVVVEIIESWSPSNYFTRVELTAKDNGNNHVYSLSV